MTKQKEMAQHGDELLRLALDVCVCIGDSTKSMATKGLFVTLSLFLYRKIVMQKRLCKKLSPKTRSSRKVEFEFS